MHGVADLRIQICGGLSIGQHIAPFTPFKVLIPMQSSNFEPGGQTLDRIVCLEEAGGNPNPQFVKLGIQNFESWGRIFCLESPPYSLMTFCFPTPPGSSGHPRGGVCALPTSYDAPDAACKRLRRCSTEGIRRWRYAGGCLIEGCSMRQWHVPKMHSTGFLLWR